MMKNMLYMSEQTEKLITAARNKGKRFKTKWPMHVGMAVVAMDTLHSAIIDNTMNEQVDEWSIRMKGNPCVTTRVAVFQEEQML